MVKDTLQIDIEESSYSSEDPVIRSLKIRHCSWPSMSEWQSDLVRWWKNDRWL